MSEAGLLVRGAAHLLTGCAGAAARARGSVKNTAPDTVASPTKPASPNVNNGHT